MGAFDVIGIDLELRFGIDFRVSGQQQIAVRLAGIGLLGAGVNMNTAIEYPVGTPVQDPLVVFLAAPVRVAVLNIGADIDVLASIGQEQPIQYGQGVLAVLTDIDFVAGNLGAGRHRG